MTPTGAPTGTPTGTPTGAGAGARAALPAAEPPEGLGRLARRALLPGLLLALGVSALVNVLTLTGSLYMLQVYDRVLASGSVPTLVALFAIVVVLYGFLGLYDFLRARILSRSAARLDRALGAAAFGGWLRAGLPGRLPGGAPGGASGDDAEGAALRDLGTLRGFVAGPAMPALLDLPFVPLFLGILFMVHPLLGWLTVAGALVGALLALLTRLLTAGAARRAAFHEGGERDLVEAARRSAETVEAMGMGGAMLRRWSESHDRALLAQQAGGDPGEALAASSRTFRMFLQSAILTLGALLVIRGDISGGMIIASSILSGRALAPVDQITGQWRPIGQAIEARRRLARARLALPPAPAVGLPDPRGRLVVAGLARLAPARPGASPDAVRPRLLSDVSFALEPGDAVAVIGASASGKSTLARLLVGALRPDAGEVRLDGATLDQWAPERRGRFLGYLPQHLDFLPGTIRDTIARFDPLAPSEEVIAAARLAGVHDMILRLPEGYDTPLGVPGRPAPLSGGQLQRVALARAVYRRPALVVLDEPNSNLDGPGEQALNRAIVALREAGSAVAVMAHRTSVLAAVNKLLMLDGGRALVFGDRDQILARAKAASGPAPLPAVPPATSLATPLAVPVPAPAAALVAVAQPGRAARHAGPGRGAIPFQGPIALKALRAAAESEAPGEAARQRLA